MRAGLKRWWWLLVLLVASVVALGFFLSRPTLVSTVVATRSEIVQTVVASGRVLPAGRVELAALGLGRVVEVTAREGARVAPGDLLARLDDTEATAELARAEALAQLARARLSRVRGPSALTAAEALRRAETDATAARNDLRRLEAVLAAGGVTPQELDRARSTVESRDSARESARIALVTTRGVDGREAAASVAQAEADVSAARARLANLRVVAPAPGILVSCSVEPGDVVTAGQGLFELAVDGPVRVRIDPDESTLALVAVGQSALVGPEAFVDMRLPAHVSYLAPAVDPLRGTIEVRLDLPDPPPELRADMTVSVDIEVARRPNALVLAAGAVRDVGTESPWVLVPEGGIAVRRTVRLGALSEDAVEILEGVAEGDAVIVSQGSGVLAGARVRVD